MNFKRAIWIALLTYILSLALGLIVTTAMGVSLAPGTELSSAFIIVNIVITIIISAIFSILYFKKVKPNAKEGFYLGITVIIVGAILDLLFFFSYSAFTGVRLSIGEYFGNALFWASIVLFLITTTLVGYIKGKRR